MQAAKPSGDATLRKGGVLSLLAALAVVCAPHAQRLPAWLSLVVGALIAWRAWIGVRGGRLPGPWLLIALAVGGGALVILSYGPMLGRDASVALLAVMTALKALELRTLRDAAVVVCLGYFLIITNFLYSQSMPTAWFMLVVMLWLTATMVAFQDRSGQMQPLQIVRSAGTLLLQAAPLMLILFLFFPRVQGPIFGFPQSATTAVTGLSDQMSPGSLSNLGLSDEVAFRVRFQASAPPSAELYWRGPVLWDFDGRTWTMGDVATRAWVDREPRGEPLSYTVTLEPHHLRWVFAVDVPGRAPPSAYLTNDYQLLAERPVRQRLRYDMVSHLRYRYGSDESHAVLQRALQLPSGFNPRARALARSLREQSTTDRELIANTLNIFRTQLFFYTLAPPELGRQSVDEFLFQTRQGFCEHYASAFAFLMRAAGVPTRIVTGYQGGEFNPVGDYLIVRQSEAHAWTEVWLAGEGWVRVDPTAAVSPARIEVGIAAALPQSDPLPLTVRGDLPLLKPLRLTLDAMSNSWNNWVLGYSPERQLQLLRRAGVQTPSWQSLAVLLMSLIGIAVLVLAAIVLSELRASSQDTVQRAWHRFCRKLRAQGIVPAPGEGPLNFAHRAAKAMPRLEPQIHAIADYYLRVRYGRAPLEEVRQLRQMVREFPA